MYPFPCSLPLPAGEARQAGAAGLGLGLGYTRHWRIEQITRSLSVSYDFC